MSYRHIAYAAAFGALVTASLPARAGEPRAVIELFTSQGCSSCPPADRVLGELAHDPSLITMSLPVDYWDYLGWKDTLALHGHANLQRAYANARGVGEIGTPQALINGTAAVLGSDKDAIEQAIARSRQNAAPLTLPVSMNVADGKVTVTVPAASVDGVVAEVWLCPITGKAEVKIGRGENRGRTLTYTNVVRRWVKLGEWTGKAQTFTVPVADLADADFSLPDIDRLDVIVQRGVAAKPGLMLGAATLALPPLVVR
ncbi:MAG TPA: DUF1223 domain-containing protein [Pseudolabrys sp.]|jgi:hypothetical protein|nr:DUF1223 domain-containing protein [Pseudolabrys sp.]